MKLKIKVGVGALIMVGVFVIASLQTWGAPVTDEAVAGITAAAPAKPTVTPKQKRRLLVFTLANGFRHSSIETGAKALEILGQKSGAWETVVSNDASIFEASLLKPFDAVCFLNTTGDVFTPKEIENLTVDKRQQALTVGQRRNKSLLDFVAEGKGFIGIHAATDTNYNWSGFGEMLGGYFDGHPWGAGNYVSIRITDKEHPLTRQFNGQNLDFKEEIYQFKAPYSRQQLRVLMELDLKKTNPKSGMKREDKDYPVSWIKLYGKGRVFYCSIGHREDVYLNSIVLEYYMAGIQFAMGDLMAPIEPLPQVKD